MKIVIMGHNMLGIYSLGNSPIYQTPLQNLTCRPKEGNKKEKKTGKKENRQKGPRERKKLMQRALLYGDT